MPLSLQYTLSAFMSPLNFKLHLHVSGFQWILSRIPARMLTTGNTWSPSVLDAMWLLAAAQHRDMPSHSGGAHFVSMLPPFSSARMCNCRACADTITSQSCILIPNAPWACSVADHICFVLALATTLRNSCKNSSHTDLTNTLANVFFSHRDYVPHSLVTQTSSKPP